MSRCCCTSPKGRHASTPFGRESLGLPVAAKPVVMYHVISDRTRVRLVR